MGYRLWSIALVIVGLLLAGVLASCERAGAATDGGRTRIVATTGMLADLVRTITGERAQVTGLMGEGVDPHLFRPTRADMAALLEADVVIYNGLLLEGKMTEALERVAASGRAVHAVAEHIGPEFLLAPQGHEGQHDPHVWMDPLAWSKAAEFVRDRLIDADPAGAALYRSNAEAYVQRLTELHAYIERITATVPAESRVLVTAHDAFNYFGHRYGYQVVGIQGISTESEAGVRDIEQLVELLVSRKVPAVFIESTVSDRNIKALIAGARARGHEVKLGGSLFSDAMGTAGTYRGTYLGMIDHNATAIVRALGGEAPEDGFQGTLRVGQGCADRSAPSPPPSSGTTGGAMVPGG